MNMTLTSIQSEAVEAILSARENGRRAASYGRSLLNRSPRVVGAIRRSFESSARKLGYPQPLLAELWSDVTDMAKLEASAE